MSKRHDNACGCEACRLRRAPEPLTDKELNGLEALSLHLRGACLPLSIQGVEANGKFTKVAFAEDPARAAAEIRELREIGLENTRFRKLVMDENANLRAVLEWYSNFKATREDFAVLEIMDWGARARAALKGTDEPETPDCDPN